MLIKAEGNLDLADRGSYTVLTRLIEQGHEEGVALVLKHKANVNAPGYLNRSPLHWAAQLNQPHIARRLIKAGADVNLGDGWATPLEAALYRGNTDLADDLIRAGAKADVRDKSGQTLLHHIIHWPDTWTARFALRHKVSINAQDNDGNTALHLAFKNVWREDVFVTLVNAGADLTLKNKKGETAFDVALTHHSYPAAKILALKMNPAPKVDALQVLHKTQWQRDELLALKKKIDGGAKVNEMTQMPFIYSPYYQNRPWPMLAYAASIRNEALLDLLLAHGADMEARGEGGAPSALEVAVAQGSWVMVHSLLQAKADVKKSPLALREACDKRYVEIARLLLQAGANPNPGASNSLLGVAISHNDFDLVDVLLDFKADIDAKTRKSSKPLLIHAWGKRSIVERLLAQKDLDVNAANKSGTTALHLAARDGDVAMIRRLLDRGAKVNALSNGNTPLDFAMKAGHEDAIQLLKSRGGESGPRDLRK
ncbi:MAG: ankyrin repeat domain-containing protein [Planctomycetes bacterium]|nr:ankyrin repeat domain-containing protein [Planctomycetota bacterium]